MWGMMCCSCWSGAALALRGCRTAGASSVSCLCLTHCLSLEQTGCCQPHILQHMHYLLSSTAMDVLLRFSVATGVPEFAAHAHIALGWWAGLRVPAPLTSPSPRSQGNSCLFGASQLYQKRKRGEGKYSSSGAWDHFSPYNLQTHI